MITLETQCREASIVGRATQKACVLDFDAQIEPYTLFWGLSRIPCRTILPHIISVLLLEAADIEFSGLDTLDTSPALDLRPRIAESL